MYIWNATKVSINGKAKVKVQFYEPGLTRVIGISRLIRNVSLKNCFSERGFLWVEVMNQKGEIKFVEFSAEEVMEVVEKWYSKGKK